MGHFIVLNIYYLFSEKTNTKFENKFFNGLVSGQKTRAASSKETTVEPLPLPPHAEMQLELQEQEMLKLERFGKILAGPNTDLG